MSDFLKLAWRNLWRSKRRTIITVTSVMFAVLFSLIMRSFQLGSYNHIVVNLVHAHSGYFQFHAKNYSEEPGLSHLFDLNDSLKNKFNIKGISSSTLRLESFALASYQNKTRAAIITGIEPEKEHKITNIKDKLIEGNFLEPNDNGVLISSGLARLLNIGLNDSLVLLGQGYQGASAAQIFPVKGIVKFGSPELDKQMVYLSIPAAQEYFSAYGMYSSAVFDLEKAKDLYTIVNELKSKIDTSAYEVLTWEEAMPEMKQQIEGDNASGIIMLGILYMIVGFGIIGTVLMMTAERRREFGVLIAIGMKKQKLIVILILEMIIIGFLGVISGMLIAFPIIYYYTTNPIKLSGEMANAMLEFGFEPVVPAIIQWDFFLNQAIIVYVIIVIASVIPAFSVSKLKVINALRK